MKKLPIGIQDFEKIITGGYVYVDKSEYIYRMIMRGSAYFLSRPRRFGKSLLVSTLAYLFQGRRELFQGLYIYDKIEWRQRPVVKLDLTQLFYKKPEDLEAALLRMEIGIADSYGERLISENYKDGFIELIRKLSSREKVAVLIDEYDKPILDFIGEPKIASVNRDILKNLYGAIKGLDAHLEFVLLTGISKFARTSIFSELNNLNDITLHHYFSSMLGYTEDEIKTMFKDFIETIEKEKNLNSKSSKSILKEISEWYNGYSWDGQKYVYNPFSVLKFFDQGEFSNYWFETGTPTFLIGFLKENNYPLTDMENLFLPETMFGSFDIEDLGIESLLFQAGYLTIKEVIDNDSGRLYRLSYPNLEVKKSLMEYLLPAYAGSHAKRELARFIELKRMLEGEDFNGFFKELHSIFAGIPSINFINKEGFYSSLTYAILVLVGIDGNPEVLTNRGRLDMVIELDKAVFIFEFKLSQSAETTLRQIRDRGYAEKYRGKGKTIFMLGVKFNSKQKNIEEWKIEKD